eukprot:126588_1
MSILLKVFPPITRPEDHKYILSNKYVPGQKSLIMPYLDPFWEFCALYIPRTTAPNVVTLLGFLIFMIGRCIYFYIDPHLSSTNPSTFACIFSAFTWFVYHTLDNIDGKHARNTKTSSPLGQLFDHGIDALLVGFVLPPFINLQGWGMIHAPMYFDLCYCIYTGCGWVGLYCLLILQMGGYNMNWKGRHIGRFDFGIISVDEMQILGELLLCFHGIYGISIFANPWVLFVEMFVMSLIIAVEFVTAHMEVYHFYQRYPFSDSFSENGNLILFAISVCLWNTVGIFKAYPLMFITVMAFTHAHLIHRLIITELTKRHSDSIQYIVIPFIFVGICSFLESQFNLLLMNGVSMKDQKIMIVMCIWSACVMFRYAIQAVVEISDVLQISIFKIDPLKQS